MKIDRLVLGGKKFDLTLVRLCHQLIENHGDFSNTCLIGVQERGVKFADRIHSSLTGILKDKKVSYGKLDVTFYRDDFRMREMPLAASMTEIDFLVDGKRVVLIDDVLYTGRTIRAALDALQHYGRPSQVELLVLVDRRFNRHLPIRADYVGVTVDALDDAYVKVDWRTAKEGGDQILLFPKKVNA